jgi:hypothetical protein
MLYRSWRHSARLLRSSAFLPHSTTQALPYKVRRRTRLRTSDFPETPSISQTFIRALKHVILIAHFLSACCPSS